VQRLGKVAEALGPDFPIAVETHAMLNRPVAIEMARRIAAMGINCMWYEEPAGPKFPDVIADIRRRIPLPVCVGERLHSRFMCRPVLERQTADVLMPDIQPRIINRTDGLQLWHTLHGRSCDAGSSAAFAPQGA